MRHPEQAGGAIVGRVTKGGGKPVVDAVVMITRDSPVHQDIAALTNEHGEYRFDALVAGKYTILVNATGLAAHIGQASVQVGQIAHLDFSLGE